MIVRASSLPNNQIIETDVCIVGAGTSGITLAREFIGQGFRVCLLESGGLEPDRETQALCWGENIGHPYFPLDTARARFFGGSSNRWDIPISDKSLGFRMRPLDEIDFEERDWIPYSGWPFRKAHLDPFYERAQSVCKVNPLSFDLNGWMDSIEKPSLPLIGDNIQTIIFKFGSRDPFISDYPREIHRASNITTYHHANVVEIGTDETAQTVTRIGLRTLEGSEFWVSANFFILAAGGIETPRLLLLSNRTQHSGLGNQNDLVGRFFMEHLHFWSGIYVPSNQEIFRSTGLYNGVHNVNGTPIIGKLAITDQAIRRERLVNYCIQLIPRVVKSGLLARFRYPNIPSEGLTSVKTVRAALRNRNIPDDLSQHLMSIARDLDDIAVTAFRKAMRDVVKIFNNKRSRVFFLAHMSEQVPNPRSRVSLDDKCDSLGLRRAKLNWQLSDIDMISAVRVQKIIAEELDRAGLGCLYIQMNDATPPPGLHGGYHHMGTTRMHVDPKKGVVDENCQVHGLSNLFVMGPSVFPTGGYANPVLTLVALSVRLADHIKDLMR